MQYLVIYFKIDYKILHVTYSLLGWMGSRGEESRGRESKLNYLVWIFLKEGEGGIWRGSNYF